MNKSIFVLTLLAAFAAQSSFAADAAKKAAPKTEPTVAATLPAPSDDAKPVASTAAKPSATAKPTCESQALDKSGKPLAGAAKEAFMKKCDTAKTETPPAQAAKSAKDDAKPTETTTAPKK